MRGGKKGKKREYGKGKQKNKQYEKRIYNKERIEINMMKIPCHTD